MLYAPAIYLNTNQITIKYQIYMTLVDILKHCPKGMKLYSPLFGDVLLYEVTSTQIKVKVKNSHNEEFIESFDNDGNYFISCYGERLLFPSKDQRDWNKFRIPIKDGDIMMIDNRAFITTGKVNDRNEPIAYCGINSDDILKIDIKDTFQNTQWTSKFYIPASEEAKKQLFKALKENGYKWDSKNKQFERINVFPFNFKPFDKVLVRDKDCDCWQPAWFKKCTPEIDNKPAPCPYRTMEDICYSQCIYYKGNEHLCFTDKNPE